MRKPFIAIGLVLLATGFQLAAQDTMPAAPVKDDKAAHDSMPGAKSDKKSRKKDKMKHDKMKGDKMHEDGMKQKMPAGK
ncbi:MAG TPA: hypothetical protein VGF59_01895 [Bryobacteraceae bacterium]|jgi:pentapeptide MXKDX repeat protein